MIRDDFPEKERLLALVVCGKPVRDMNPEDFNSSTSLSEWFAYFWPAFQAAFPEPDYAGIKNLNEMFVDLFERIHQRLEVLRAAEHLAKPVVVNGISYQAIQKFDVYYSGWDCDSEGAVVETPEGPKLVLSNHGCNYFADQKELEDKIDEYEEAIAKSKAALALLKPKSRG